MRVRECVLSSLRVLAPVPPTAPTTYHPLPSLSPSPRPPFHQHPLGGSQRSRERNSMKRGNHPAFDEGEEDVERERVARMRFGTRGGLPGAISRGRRCRRPKTLIARVVDARRIFRRTSSALGYTYLCPPHLPLIPLSRSSAVTPVATRRAISKPSPAFRSAARRVCTACTRSSIAVDTATTRRSFSSPATIATGSLRRGSCTSPTTARTTRTTTVTIR